MTENVFVFVGPSLTAEDKKPYPGVTFLPPVADGDIFRLLESEPTCIGIIDGYFGTRLAISHKEILVALSKGIPVSGAASMGALRAAELDTYGLTGIGEIYRCFRSGRLQDDGEVAVAHAPEDLGFATTSIALVDVRATVKSLLETGQILPTRAAKLIYAAKRLPFEDRSWQALVDLSGTDPSMVHQLTVATVQQKRLDAIALVQHVTRHPAEKTPAVVSPPPNTPALQKTRERAFRNDAP